MKLLFLKPLTLVALKLKEQTPERIRILPRLSLPVLQAVMNRVRLVIAMDSLPLHLAGTTSTPTFSVFGASSMQKYKPLGGIHHGLQGECPYNVSFEKRCARLRSCKTGACIRSLTGKQVMDALTRHSVFS
ncbi:hypothetical protein SCG7086_AS_00250 [Chlamydiales bacterium SCGC AG-110-P3]|nr:hypothetical protein SCG7086_AS_00250 [Chlamydiales bacterium SCGC AG-110-P3]